MTPTNTARQAAAPVGEVVQALVSGPYLTELADVVEGSRIGRPRHHPKWVALAYGALARHFRSFSHTDTELADGLWDRLRQAADTASLPDPGNRVFTYQQFRYWRDRTVQDDDTFQDLLDRFSDIAMDQAKNAGLLTCSSEGSLTRPHPNRTIYGDGTIVRPIFRSPTVVTDTTTDPDGAPRVRFIDRRTGEITDTPTGRYDPDAVHHYRHDGPILGNAFVAIFARGLNPHSRIVLAIDRVKAPGREAECAIGLIKTVVDRAKGGIQAVAYDGAFHGTHIDQVMRQSGLVVVNRMAPASRAEDGTTTPKQRPIETFTHDTARGPCHHTLHVRNGTVIDVDLADDASLVVVNDARRKQVKRFNRKDGTYRFSLGLEIPCKHGDFRIWLSPHAKPPRMWAPEHIRLIPPDDPHFQTLYGMRADAESFNNQYKRSLLVGRAASIGWRRQLFDLLTYSVLHNSLTARRGSDRLGVPCG